MKIWQVDSFADGPFTGNPAGVCILEQFPEDDWMQRVAMEMNCAETAFVVPRADGTLNLRWFTPNVEVDLCGHATLAATQVLLTTGRAPAGQPLRFATKSGELTCHAAGDLIQMDFPATPPQVLDDASLTAAVLAAIGVEQAVEILQSRFDLLVVLDDAAEVEQLEPDLNAITKLDARGVIVTAKSNRSGADFISRFFAPRCDVDEDPVTGSAHCCLAPYWGRKLSQQVLRGYQASRRGGYVDCEIAGDRVQLSGKAHIVIAGELYA